MKLNLLVYIICIGVCTCLFDTGDFKRIFSSLGSNELNQIARCYSIDGYGNNLDHPEWGSAHHIFERLMNPAFQDRVQEMPSRCSINQRVISNVLGKSDDNIKTKRHTSDLVWVFGQFIDHDITLSDDGSEASPINIVKGDTVNATAVPFNRLPSVARRGKARQYENLVTSFLDLSMVYGSDKERSKALRTLRNGKMKVSRHSSGDLLPTNFKVNGNYLPNSVPTNRPEDFYVAGDLRVNVMFALASLQTLFLREHNRLADKISKALDELDMYLTDQTIWQWARACNIMQYQRIVFNEWLPAIIGNNAPRYREIEYDEEVDISIPVEFATTAMRFGHTLISNAIKVIYNKNRVETILLKDSFFNISVMKNYGIEPILRGLAYQSHQEADLYMVNGIRDELFQGKINLIDLFAIDIKRACDTGVQGYTDMYKFLFGRNIAYFRDITPNSKLQKKLSQLYTHVRNVDPLIGMLAEEPIRGSLFGKTLTTMLDDAFSAWVEADRCFYTHLLQDNYYLFKRAIDPVKLSHIIYANTDLTKRDIQENVFYSSEY